MSKYDFELDLNNENSLSCILKYITPNSTILEFGPSHGRLTKYLTETLNCTVDIIELDEHAGKEAATYARHALIGSPLGNIENKRWTEALKDCTYDFILFADVLEHLYDPKSALALTRTFLKDDGKVLISMPNFGHNGVLLEIFAEEFNYRPTGLLDDTHIRFFTYQTFLTLIKNAGFVATIEDGVTLGMDESEFGYHKANTDPALLPYIEQRPFGTVYQFIFVLEPSERKLKQSIVKLANTQKNIHAKLYFKTSKNDIYSEEQYIRSEIIDGHVCFNLENYPNIFEYRFDPCETAAIVYLNDYPQHSSIIATNALISKESLLFFSTSDPHIIFKPDIALTKKISFQVDIISPSLTMISHHLGPILNAQSSLIAQQQDQLQTTQASLSAVHQSTSWYVTKPLRFLSRAIKKGINRFLRPQPQIANNTPTFIDPNVVLNTLYSSKGYLQSADAVFVPKSLKDNRLPSQIKALAFYLPQFHPFPENEAWWGKGFTEWNNVTRAKPQFNGHYQPHLPENSGFYDLRLTFEVMRQQIDLAKLYGLHGFCFYHYWFSGKRLMELPVNNFLKDKSLDINFCLCWANENWSRRWDGKADDILIAQNYSPQDDIAFFEDILPALQDARYITIDDKPVLLLYRASLLPDAKATGRRWREQAQKHGLKGLYLVTVNSFDTLDPAVYGFDACVEFPPLQTVPQEVSDQYELLNPNYRGSIYDYSSLPHELGLVDREDIIQFKGVMPSWDNEARRPGRGHVFINSSPEHYATWLDNAARVTMKKRPEERFVFINAWNEWAEGAHLEPCQKYGYAYLQATSAVLANYINYKNDYLINLNKSFSKQHETVIILHLFYEDLIDSIFDQYLKELTQCCDLIVTIQDTISNSALDKIRSYFPNSYFLVVKNRGRDLLPFIKALNFIKDLNYNYLCKLHSKKSPHRTDGDQWRDTLFSKLVPSAEKVQLIIKQFKDNPNIGLMAPQEMLFSLGSHPELYMGNIHWLDQLLTKLNQPEYIGNYAFIFPAGTMYWIKTAALKPLMNAALVADSDFEPEAGQLDGTLAHALERIIGVIITNEDLTIESL